MASKPVIESIANSNLPKSMDSFARRLGRGQWKAPLQTRNQGMERQGEWQRAERSRAADDGTLLSQYPD